MEEKIQAVLFKREGQSENIKLKEEKEMKKF